MKLEIIIRSTAYSTTFEYVANDPANEGKSVEALLYMQGENQSAYSIEVGINEDFEVEKENEGEIEGFVDDFEHEQKLEGQYKIGDTLQPGFYRFDGRQIIGPKKRFSN